jgi:hypothetical protein
MINAKQVIKKVNQSKVDEAYVVPLYMDLVKLQGILRDANNAGRTEITIRSAITRFGPLGIEPSVDQGLYLNTIRDLRLDMRMAMNSAIVKYKEALSLIDSLERKY